MRSSQPKQLYILSFTQMLKFFSHYGNRALLVLYMIGVMGLPDKHAFGIYAVYGGFVELGAAFGGMLADRYLGRRRAVMLGALTIAAGHLLMTFGASFYLGLASIAVGCLLFSTNLFTLLGEYYEEEDTRREKGFTILYILMNIGALVATMLCSYLSTHVGWHYGYGLAAIGMLLCCAILFIYRVDLVEKPKEISGRGQLLFLVSLPILLLLYTVLITHERYTLPLLTPLTIAFFFIFGYSLRHDARRITYLIGLILFLVVEEQICTSILLYGERHTTCFLSSGFLLSINPIVIMVAGPWIHPISQRISKFRLPFVFGFLALSFGLFALPMLFGLRINYFGVSLLVAAITAGELFLTPFVYSLFSERGEFMGLIPLGSALAAQMGGGLAKLLPTEGAMVAYGQGFGWLAIALALISLLAMIELKLRHPLFFGKLQEGKG